MDDQHREEDDMFLVPGWITVKQAAKKYGYHEDTIRRLIRNNDIQARKIGTAYVINEKSLKDYKDSVTIGRPPKDET